MENLRKTCAAGWCIWVFVIVSGALLTLVNYKLIWVVRYVTRGGNIHLLKNGVFWANRPGLLLPIIKFLLFFVSYVYANAIFFATQFGTKSCFFSRAGFQGQPVPWWVSLSCFSCSSFSSPVCQGLQAQASICDRDASAGQELANNHPSLYTTYVRQEKSLIAVSELSGWSYGSLCVPHFQAYKACDLRTSQLLHLSLCLVAPK